MSGGSFNYLCNAEFHVEYPLELSDMASELRELGAVKAANDTTRIIDRFHYLQSELERLITPELRNVWHAVEWYYSNDWAADQRDKVLDEYEQRTSES